MVMLVDIHADPCSVCGRGFICALIGGDQALCICEEVGTQCQGNCNGSLTSLASGTQTCEGNPKDECIHKLTLTPLQHVEITCMAIDAIRSVTVLMIRDTVILWMAVSVMMAMKEISVNQVHALSMNINT